MAQLLDSKDVAKFKELLMANTIQIDTIMSTGAVQ